MIYVLRVIITLPFGVGVHLLRRTLYHKHLLLEGLATFDLQHAKCRLQSDRDFVYKAIVDWYGTAETFNHYVQGTLRQELLQASSNFTVPVQYYPVIVGGFVGGSLDELLALYLARVPWRSVLAHFFVNTAGMTAAVIIALELTAYLSYRWAHPCKNVVLNALLSLVLYLPVLACLTIGSVAGLGASNRGFARTIVYSLLSAAAAACTVRFYRLRPGQRFWSFCQRQEDTNLT